MVDARLFQIVSLACLLCLELTTLDFGATPAQAATPVTSTLLSQALLSRLVGARFDWRSPLITGMSLSLLLRSHDPLVWAAAGAVAMATKFAIRHRGKHVFNPACIAIVVMLASGQAWVSPGLWGSSALLALLVGGLGALVLSRSDRLDICLAFLGCWAALLAWRAVRLGDPWAIPLHQMQSGSLLIFGLFMITDPRATPDDRLGRIAFAIAVAALGHWLQFHMQVREGLFWALAIVSVATPLIDRLRPAERFRWTTATETAR